MYLPALDISTLSEEALDLKLSLEKFTTGWGMLSGLSLSYGNASNSESIRMGLAQEEIYQNGRFTESRIPIRPDSLYDLASLTKLFTLVATLQLIQRRKIYFEDFIGILDKRFTKLRDTNIFDVLSYQAVLRSPQRIDMQPDAAAAEKQIFLTSRYHDSLSGKLYSDMNALLLKYIIEQASGLSFEEYLKKNIFTVLGMKDTFSAVPEDRLPDCLNYNYEHRIVDKHYVIEENALPGTVHDPKARFLMKGGLGLQGHAGLFSSAQDMVCFAQGLLRGDLLGRELFLEIGKNRTGFNAAGKYRQFMGYLCFSKSPVQHLSEVPGWMGPAAFGIAGYTGNHFALDPELGVFDILLGNRCHMRVSKIEPSEKAIETYNLSQEGAGLIRWPDGRLVKSSFRFVHQKDILIHEPVYHELQQREWL